MDSADKKEWKVYTQADWEDADREADLAREKYLAARAENDPASEAFLDDYYQKSRRPLEIHKAMLDPPWRSLMEALMSSKLADVKTMFESGEMDMDLLNKHGVAILAQPAVNGDVEVLEYLLSLGADPNLRAGNGLTALLFAAQRDEKEVFLKLLAAGADPSMKTLEGDTIKDLARYSHSEKILKVIKDKNLVPAFNARAKKAEPAKVKKPKAMRATRKAK